jgi:hypothetical protein
VSRLICGYPVRPASTSHRKIAAERGGFGWSILYKLYQQRRALKSSANSRLRYRLDLLQDAKVAALLREFRSVNKRRFSARGIWRALGPGLVTGGADDDPSGIATYSQAGAQFGFSLLWTVFLTLPFMAAIQIISAVIDWDTKQGLARNIARVLPRWALYPLVASLLVANTINIAADLAARARPCAWLLAALRLRSQFCAGSHAWSPKFLSPITAMPAS